MLEPLQEAIPPALLERLSAAKPAELAALLVSGVRREPVAPGRDTDELFEIPPVPNLCFQRDPQIVIGARVVIGAMATPARWRESLLATTVFRFHPAFAAVPRLLEPVGSGSDQAVHLGPQRPHFEGGDVLVLSPEVLAVGVSQRTNRTGVQRLARALARLDGGPRWLILVGLPSQRAYMHLDTVMTPVDRDACLVFPALVEPGGPGAARIVEIDLHARERTPVARPDLLAALRRRGVDLEPIPCGGGDPMLQQREQWTDGANALAVAPGVILMYDRNVATAAELGRAGFRVLEAEDLLRGRTTVAIGAERACILLSSNEISRARGGPHCLSQPLVREPL
jgi:arginine deiminase